MLTAGRHVAHRQGGLQNLCLGLQQLTDWIQHLVVFDCRVAVRPLLKCHVPEIQHASYHAVDLHNLLLLQPERLPRSRDLGKFCLVIEALDHRAASFLRVFVAVRPHVLQLFARLLRQVRQLVEHVVVPLVCADIGDNPRLLQQVLDSPAAHDFAGRIEMDLQVLSEATGVVVLQGLGVAKRLQDGAGAEQQLLRPSSVRVRPSNLRKKLHTLLGLLGLSRARLAADDHRLVFQVLQHVLIAVICQPVHVRRHLLPRHPLHILLPKQQRTQPNARAELRGARRAH